MKFMKNVAVLLIAILMAFSFVGCENDSDDKRSKRKDDGIDYQKMIDSYVEDSFNTEDLVIGEDDAPSARVWLKDGKGTVYTSDENVVTVSDLGKVTAVGEGSAFVVITTNRGKMFEVYKYNVYSELPERKSVESIMQEEEIESTLK